LQTGRALREQEAAKGNVTTHLPYKMPEFQTLTLHGGSSPMGSQANRLMG
jgi:hypothetical protein